jgi:hypothetical protein
VNHWRNCQYKFENWHTARNNTCTQFYKIHEIGKRYTAIRFFLGANLIRDANFFSTHQILIMQYLNLASLYQFTANFRFHVGLLNQDGSAAGEKCCPLNGAKRTKYEANVIRSASMHCFQNHMYVLYTPLFLREKKSPPNISQNMYFLRTLFTLIFVLFAFFSPFKLLFSFSFIFVFFVFYILLLFIFSFLHILPPTDWWMMETYYLIYIHPCPILQWKLL